MQGRVPAFVLLALGVMTPCAARAGGFYLPDNGTQAMGRGAAFVAKADDPTAIYWNPGGLARQRGTKLLVDANIDFHSFSFQRLGVYPDDANDPATPWGGQPFPKAVNTAGPFVAPFFALTTDFGYFDRLTFALGVFGPPAIGNRTFPLTVGGAPSPTRYDFVQSRSTLIFPTAAAAFRITPWLDFGVSGHVVVAKFDQTNITYAEAVPDQCKNVEYLPCDSRNEFVASATTVAGTFGLILRPAENVSFGLALVTPIGLTATGTTTPTPPTIAQVNLVPGAATLYTNLPLQIRLGGRWIEMDADFELYDLELDATYEAWGTAQATGPRALIPDVGAFKNIDSTVIHAYKDTFSVRAGGAYNLEALSGVLSVRAGAYFDSPASDFAYTRADFDTLAKAAGTLGLGYKKGAFALDLAYAAVASVPRTVGSGQGNVRPINGSKNGRTVDGNEQLLPAVNEGVYRGFTHVVSLGATVTFDAFFGGPPRAIHYGNKYEPGYVGPGEAEPKEQKETKEPEKEKEKEKEEPKPAVEEPKKKPEKKKEPEPAKKKEWWEELD